MCWSACTKHLWSTLNELDVSLDITLTWLMDSKISIYLLLLWSWNDFAKQACFVAFTLLYMTEQSVRLVPFFGLLKAVSHHSLVQAKAETLLQLLERSSQSPWPFPVITWAAYAKRECILPLGPNKPCLLVGCLVGFFFFCVFHVAVWYWSKLPFRSNEFNSYWFCMCCKLLQWLVCRLWLFPPPPLFMWAHICVHCAAFDICVV